MRPRASIDARSSSFARSPPLRTRSPPHRTPQSPHPPSRSIHTSPRPLSNVSRAARIRRALRRCAWAPTDIAARADSCFSHFRSIFAASTHALAYSCVSFVFARHSARQSYESAARDQSLASEPNRPLLKEFGGVFVPAFRTWTRTRTRTGDTGTIERRSVMRARRRVETRRDATSRRGFGGIESCLTSSKIIEKSSKNHRAVDRARRARARASIPTRTLSFFLSLGVDFLPDVRGVVGHDVERVAATTIARHHSPRQVSRRASLESHPRRRDVSRDFRGGAFRRHPREGVDRRRSRASRGRHGG